MATEPAPAARRPWLTATLVAANAGLFGVTVLLSRDVNPSLDILALGWMNGLSVAAGQTWRLVTCCFLHAGWAHLLVNVWVLWQVGALLEGQLGPAQTFVLYLCSGVAGAAASYQAGSFATVGASGAVIGLMAAGVVLARVPGQLAPAARRELGWPALFWLGAVLCLGWLVPRVDNWAHFGGALAGAVLAPLTLIGGRRPWRRVLLRVAAAAGVVVVAASVAVMLRAARAEGDWQRRELTGLGLSVEIPAQWLPRSPAADTVTFGAPGVPAKITIRRLALPEPVPVERQAAWVARRTRPLHRVAGPEALHLDDRVLWWVRLWPEAVIEQYYWFETGEVIELTGTVRADRLRRYRPVFGHAAASLERWP